jgi:hypothetical protein
MDHKDFRLLTKVTNPPEFSNAFVTPLNLYLKQFEADKCGLNTIVGVKISYNKITDTFRARIDSKKKLYQGNNDNPLLLFETDYVEYRVGSDVVVHLGTRLDPEERSGTGLVGRIATVKELADWACWIDRCE